MRSRSSLLGLSLVGWLSAVTLACGLVACGGSPEVVSGSEDPTLNAGSGGQGAGPGTGGSGATLNLPGDGGSSDGGAIDIPEPGPGCGDGEVNQAAEECDDGNTLPGDGCSGACTE